MYQMLTKGPQSSTPEVPPTESFNQLNVQEIPVPQYQPQPPPYSLHEFSANFPEPPAYQPDDHLENEISDEEFDEELDPEEERKLKEELEMFMNNNDSNNKSI